MSTQLEQTPKLNKSESMDQHIHMYVIKRDGRRVELSYEKILQRIKKVGKEVGVKLSFINLVYEIIDQLHNDIHTSKIDELVCELCACKSQIDYDYYKLASALCISNHQKMVSRDFVKNYTHIMNSGKNYISNKFVQYVTEHETELTEMINYKRDYLIDYFGFKTLERAYLMRDANRVIHENIQHLFMRVAVQIHIGNMEKIKKTYDGMSQKYFIHATPTLFNSCTKRPQLSSCFLLGMEDDSIDGIYNTLHDVASISKWAGGIGLHIHNIRASGTLIEGTNGTSNGLVPMLKVFNATARYVDQGGGKRNGSFAMYLEPWHSDIEKFLELKKNHGDEETKARDLFYALWIPDLFMKQVKADSDWYLMCPHKCPGLSDTHSEDFEDLYWQYVSEKKYNKKVSARELWFAILDSQMETGTPYIMFKDACNKKSNQKNLGTIKSSNLCTEVVQYSDSRESAVCNLASISLSAMVDISEDGTPEFNYERLQEVAETLTENLNNVIDVNFYPTVKTKRSNRLHRPIGLGVQGLADCFAKMNMSFDSDEAQALNKQIFETIYYASMKMSNKISVARYNKKIKYLMSPLIILFSKVKQIRDLFELSKSTLTQKERANIIEMFKNALYNNVIKDNGDVALEDKSVYNLFRDFKVLFDTFMRGTVYEENMMLITNQHAQKHRLGPKTLDEIYENLEFHTKDVNVYELFGYNTVKQMISLYNTQIDVELLETTVWKNITNCLSDSICNNYDNLSYTQHGSYSSFAGSPLSNGLFQFNLWNEDADDNEFVSERYDWDSLRASIYKFGVRNSLCIAPMPTASTSQILANNECFEPFTSNLYTRKTNAGEFIVVNKYLMNELKELKLWDVEMKNEIIRQRGSIQNITKIPQTIRDKFKTSWDMSMKRVIDMAADRGTFVCQSQSMNLWVEDPNYKNLTSMLFYAWSKGLKTGMYYMRRKAKYHAQQFTIEPISTPVKGVSEQEDNHECEFCSA